MLCINNVADHIHLFIGMTPAQSASDLMRIIKADSTKWINSQHPSEIFLAGRFWCFQLFPFAYRPCGEIYS